MRSLWNAPRKKRDDGWQRFAPREDEMSGMGSPLVPGSTTTSRGPGAAGMTYRDMFDIAPEERNVGPTQEKKSFMEGGDFGWRDGLGLALAGIGDAFTREGGGEGGALNSMIGRAYSAKDMAKKAQEKSAEDAAKFEDAYGTYRSMGYPDAQAQAMAKGMARPSDFAPEKDDVFTAMMRNGGIDPDSEEGKALYKQRATTMANPMYQGWDGQRYGGAPAAPTSNDGWGDVTPEEEAAYRQRQGGAGPGQRGFRIPRLR